MTATQAAVEGNKDAEVELVLFKEAFGPNVKARIRVLVLPALYETMAFITEDARSYHIVYLYSQRPLVAYWMKMLPDRKTGIVPPNPDPAKAEVARREIAIPSSLAAAIISDWKKLLLQTRYESKHEDAQDGARFVLSMEDETGRYAGQTWNPLGELPVLTALQSVAFDMTVFCGYGPVRQNQCEVADIGKLQTDVDALTKVLAEHPP